MSRIELTDGSPVPTDGSHTEILPSGQQRAYVVLSQEERAKGFVKPLRRSYVHSKCGVTTTMGRSIAETYARDPRFYTGTFCVRCRAHFSLSEFVWEDGEPMNPNDQDEWQRTEGERRRKARIARLQNLVAQLRSDLAAAERDLSQCTSDQPTPALPQPLNVDGIILSDGRAMLVGTATWDNDTGKYRCLANIEGALCVVEIKVTPRAADNGDASRG